MPAGSRDRPAAGLWGPALRVRTVAVVTVVVLVAFEAFAVVTATPVAAAALNGLRDYGLAFSLFSTTALLGIVVAGDLADRRGPAPTMLVGLGAFGVGLLVTGAAQSFGVFLLGRAMAGFGAGIEMVSMYVLVAALFPEPLHPRVFGVISAGWVLPSLLGPPIAGLLAEAVSWRAAFLAVLPLLPLPLWVLWHRLRGWRPGAATQRPSGGSGRLLFGLLLAGGAGLGQGAWHLLAAPAGTSRWAWAAAVAGTALAGLGLVGLLPTGVWRLRRGTASLVTFRAGINAAFFGGEAFVTLMLVEQRGAAPVLAGMALTVASLGWSAASWSQGHWPSRRPDGVDRFRLAAVGAAVLAAGLFALTATPLDRVPAALVAPFWGLAGLGMGWAMSCSSVLMLRLAPPGTAGRTATSVQLGDNLGTMLGIGAAGALFAARYRPDGDHAGVFVAIWAGLGLVALLTALVGLRIRPRAGASPASTPGPGSAEPVESR